LGIKKAELKIGAALLQFVADMVCLGLEDPASVLDPTLFTRHPFLFNVEQELTVTVAGR